MPLSTRPPLLIAIGEIVIPVRPAVLLLPVHPTFLESSLDCQGGYGKCHIIRTWEDGFKLKMGRIQAAGRAPRAGRGGEGKLAKGIEPPTY